MSVTQSKAKRSTTSSTRRRSRINAVKPATTAIRPESSFRQAASNAIRESVGPIAGTVADTVTIRGGQFLADKAGLSNPPKEMGEACHLEVRRHTVSIEQTLAFLIVGVHVPHKLRQLLIQSRGKSNDDSSLVSPF